MPKKKTVTIADYVSGGGERSIAVDPTGEGLVVLQVDGHDVAGIDFANRTVGVWRANPWDPEDWENREWETVGVLDVPAKPHPDVAATSGPVEPEMFVMDVTASNGTPFRVVLYRPGAVNYQYPAATDEDRSLVEFYDRRYRHTEHGQFVGSRYYLDDLLEHQPGRGLTLQGGVEAWSVDGTTMDVIRLWLITMAGRYALADLRRLVGGGGAR